jgi:hypothetical protein
MDVPRVMARLRVFLNVLPQISAAEPGSQEWIDRPDDGPDVNLHRPARPLNPDPWML